MRYVIESGSLRAQIDPAGAQLMSLQKGGLEYLWQGDARYWQRRAPLLFPFVGRLLGECYLLHGKKYSMGIHGFLSHQVFAAKQLSAGQAELSYRPNERVQEQYPFSFCFTICYSLCESCLYVDIRIENTGSDKMPFALGWHPGFRVPLEETLRFEDYALQFAPDAVLRQVQFSDTKLVIGAQTPFCPAGNKIRLRHELFHGDAVVLQGSGGWVCLSAGEGTHGLRMEYPKEFYLGLWHRPQTDAPYVCIEPWSALPGRADRILEPERCDGFCQLPPGKTAKYRWTVTLF